ncbi:type IV pilin PilA [Microcystis aeruginosa NIES-44]|uniref:Type IV pilin PilA n=1 Tax=Microcystis aeruginosa NIES-44 TaxID=449439 RepID=A0A0A1W1L1_MICAE|nr:type IV pilin PilA [Microcystis aeruginosa NIES-44]
MGAGCGVWGVGFYRFSGKKSLNFPPDHSQMRYFLISKRSKSLTQQGF